MAISERKKTILKTIIKEYLKTAQPVSSGLLVEKYKLNCSPATVRNEMMELEEEGYIFQPHTSAGRLPTALAYKLCLADLKPKLFEGEKSQALEKNFSREENDLKKTAKIIAELSGCAVFWAFHKNDLYYTGISNLFSQPEFKQMELIYDVSKIIDKMEEIIEGMFEEKKEELSVLVGEDNPFGHFLSTILVRYNYKNQSGLVGLLGPMRMDYEKNLAIMNWLKHKLA